MIYHIVFLLLLFPIAIKIYNSSQDLFSVLHSVRAGRNMQQRLHDKCVFVIYRCVACRLHCLINMGVKGIGWEEAD